MVRLREELPLPPQFTVQTDDFWPLQEARMKIAENPRIKRARFEFMQTPHFKIQHQAGRAIWLGNPQK
jgi:hypothetical protein